MSQAGEIPFDAEQFRPRGRDDANISYSPLFVSYFQVCSVVLLRLLDLFSFTVSYLIMRQQRLESPLW